jgi:hypothetical protein
MFYLLKQCLQLVKTVHLTEKLSKDKILYTSQFLLIK